MLSILLVEDDRASVEALREMLEEVGHRVVWARNGLEALEHLGSDTDFSVILLDLMMPKMNGFEFRQEQLRNPKLASIPVIVLSADGRAEELAKRLRTNRFLQKPFSPRELLGAIHEYSGSTKPSS
jgi:CheY-like chemotaxis protein